MAISIPDNQDANPAADPPPLNELNRLEVLQGLRVSIWEGSFATIWIALTSGVFLTGYALWLGADNKTLGLITAIPTFAALIQIVSAFLGERLQARKPFTAWFSLAGRLLWLPILLLPLLLPHSLALAAFLVLYAASSALLNIPSPAYMSWMSDLVPPNHRGRYFGRRNMIAGVVALVIGLPAAWFLDFATKTPPLGGMGLRDIVRSCHPGGDTGLYNAAASAGTSDAAVYEQQKRCRFQGNFGILQGPVR